MATTKKKAVKRFAKGRPDRYKKGKNGYTSQTIRMTVDENQLIRKAAENQNMSINHWCFRVLMSAAQTEIDITKT